MKLTQKAISPYMKVLIYGPPKTGKSELAGRLAEFKNLLWFDLENGYSTLLKLPMEWQERIEIISLPDTRTFPIAIETCLKVIKGGKVSICETHGKVSCPSCNKENNPTVSVELNSLQEDTVVVFDSLTQLTASAIAKIASGHKSDDDKFEYDDWAKLGYLMDMFLSHIQQAQYNVVCISHEQEAELEDGTTKLVPVAGTRNFSRNTAKFFDSVVYCRVQNKKHNFYSSTTSINNVVAGSRNSVALENTDGNALIELFTTKPRETTSNIVKSPNSTATSGLEALKAKIAAQNKG